MFASPVTESERESPRRPYETVAAPDQIPLYALVSVKGPAGEPLDAYRGIRRRDTSEIASIVVWFGRAPRGPGGSTDSPSPRPRIAGGMRGPTALPRPYLGAFEPPAPRLP